MEQTLQALAGILQKATLTIGLLVILHFYLKAMLFKPLEKVLKQRDDLTEGARRGAERSLAEANRKAEEYEAKLREARAEVYHEHEEMRRRWLEDQTAQIAESKKNAAVAVAKIREEIRAEAIAVRQTLAETSGTLADQIATAVLSGRRQ